MSATNFLEKVSLEIGQAFLPLRQTVKAGVSDSAFEELFQEVGWELRSFLSEEEIKRIRNAVESATEFLDHSNDLSKLVSGLPDLVETFETLFNPSELQFESADFKNSFSELGFRLLDALVISHLQRRFPITHNLLVFLGIIHIRYVPSSESISSHITWDFDWDNLQRIFSEPEKVFRDQRTYHWGYADFDARKLFVNLQNVLWLFGIPVGIQSQDQDSIRVLSPDSTSDPILRIPVLTKIQEGIIQQAGASLIPYRATAGEGYAGIALVVFGLAQLEKDFTLGKHWIGTVRGQAEALSTQGIVWDFQKGLSLSPFPGEGLRPPNFEIFVALIKKSEADSKDTLFGSPTGSNLSVGTFGFRGGIELNGNSISEIFLETFLEQASLKITAGSHDAFLKKALPNGVVIPFDLIVGSSTDRGLYFGGSAGLSVKFPIRKTLGPLCVHALTLKAHIGEEAKLNAVAAISFSLKLGPATVSLDEVGLDLGVLISRSPSFSVNPYGPSGGGISIKAAGVSGGGYLSIDKANYMYSGALQLRFEKLGLSAVGFITTGGPQGFSMVINIGVLFSPPVQLSFGFQLSGVGGLIAIKRTMSTNALQAGVADGSLESLMFPSDPVGDAPALISQLKNILPPDDGRYVVGPMVRLTWGAKSLIKADLGIFLELPAPLRIFLVGQLEGTFPHEDQALIQVKVGILGLLDFGKKVLSIDARLYDSRILVYELSGDMALRLSWGNDPYFIISMGGFHPRYAVPSVYPPFLSPMRRLRLELGSGSAFNLSCESYLALSTNTLQFGARAELYVKAGPAKVEGYLGFDTLIIFSPFSFEVEIQAGVRVKVKGRNVAGVSLAFVLSGPTPWRARGKAKIKILFFKFKVRFNKSWGRSDQVRIPGKDPLPDLLQVLAQRQSWGTVMPIGRLTMESLKPLTTVPATAQGDMTNNSPPDLPLAVHPQGTLELRQSLLPLGLRLKFYENAPVSGHDAFDITKVVVGGQTFLPKEKVPDNTASSSFSFSPVQEFFARCQFLSCSKQEKLAAPSFEKLDAGVALTSHAIQLPPHTSTNQKENFLEKAPLNYESSVIDEDRTTVRQQKFGGPIPLANRRLLRGNSARRSGYRRDPSLRYGHSRQVSKISLPRESFRIIGSVTLQPLSAKELRILRFRKSGEMTRAEADEVLARFEKAHPEKKGAYQIVSAFEAGI